MERLRNFIDKTKRKFQKNGRQKSKTKTKTKFDENQRKSGKKSLIDINKEVMIGKQLASNKLVKPSVEKCEKSCEVKSLKQEINKQIELVGNYFKKSTHKSTDKSKSLPIVDIDDNNNNIEEIEVLSDERHKSNDEKNSYHLSSQSIEFKVHKSPEYYLKCGNQLYTTSPKSSYEELVSEVKSTSFDSHILKTVDNFGDSLSTSDYILQYNEFKSNHLNDNQKSDGQISIKDIDIKSAKCILCWKLVFKDIQITNCSHIYCSNCLNKWLKFSQHCPKCRSFITCFAHSLQIGSNHRIAIYSADDYKVTQISRNDANYVDSLCASYLWHTYCYNREDSQFLDNIIGSLTSKVSQLESEFLHCEDINKKAIIRYAIDDHMNRLDDWRQMKMKSDESLNYISGETKPQMMSFWKQMISTRNQSVL